MVSWICPICEQAMYSADPKYDQPTVQCIYCGGKFTNTYSLLTDSKYWKDLLSCEEVGPNNVGFPSN